LAISPVRSFASPVLVAPQQLGSGVSSVTISIAGVAPTFVIHVPNASLVSLDPVRFVDGTAVVTVTRRAGGEEDLSFTTDAGRAEFHVDLARVLSPEVDIRAVDPQLDTIELGQDMSSTVKVVANDRHLVIDREVHWRRRMCRSRLNRRRIFRKIWFPANIGLVCSTRSAMT